MPGSIFLLKICFIFDFFAGWYIFLVSCWPISILKHRELPSISWPQWTGNSNSFVGCCSVMQLCWTLCDPMDCSTPDFPVLQHLLEFAQTHVHWVSDVIQTISSSVIPFSSCLQSFPASGSFPMSQLFTAGGQGIGVLASAWVLPMNFQGWLPLGLTDLISLLKSLL